MMWKWQYDKDIHDMIGTNKYNEFGRSGEDDVIKEEGKVLTGGKDRELIKNIWNSKLRILMC